MDKDLLIDNLAKTAVIVTSYEGKNPILTHIFWGDTTEDAFGSAKAHLITDYFFSSTFVGAMEWHGEDLILEYESEIIGIHKLKDEHLFQQLKAAAKQVNKEQKKYVAPGINKIAENQ